MNTPTASEGIPLPPPPLNESRREIEEMLVVGHAVKKGENQYGVDPSSLRSPEGRALLAVVDPERPRSRQELVREALRVAEDTLRVNADAVDISAHLEDCLYQVENNPENAAQQAAARLRLYAAYEQATQAYRAALDDHLRDPSPKTLAAVGEAMLDLSRNARNAPQYRRELADLVEAIRTQRLASQGRTAVGVKTPAYPQLSAAFCGWRGLTFLAAMPGIGKTTLATAAMFDAVGSQADVCGVFVSFEMPTQTLVERTLSQMSGIGQRTLRLGDPDYMGNRTEGMRLSEQDYRKLVDAEDRLHMLDKAVSFVGRDSLGAIGGKGVRGRDCLDEIATIVEGRKRLSGRSRVFVVLDHLGAIPAESPDGRAWPNDTERARYILDGLSRLRERIGQDDPLIVVAQSRKSDWTNPDLASLLGTADIGYAADAVVVFGREEDEKPDEKPDGPVDIVAKIVKGRDMMLRSSVKMRLDPGTSRISEVDDGKARYR